MISIHILLKQSSYCDLENSEFSYYVVYGKYVKVEIPFLVKETILENRKYLLRK